MPRNLAKNDPTPINTHAHNTIRKISILFLRCFSLWNKGDTLIITLANKTYRDHDLNTPDGCATSNSKGIYSNIANISIYVLCGFNRQFKLYINGTAYTTIDGNEGSGPMTVHTDTIAYIETI